VKKGNTKVKPLRYHNKRTSVVKTFTFDAAHQLDAYIGKCADLHGHTYKLEVEVKGRPDERGIVIDFAELKQIVRETVVGPLDHTYLNDHLPFNTTAENMVVFFYERIRDRLAGMEEKNRVTLERVRLWETPTCYAEVTWEDMQDEGQ
jgi:6-pyruvoyltetrahydropterin/6-carboxytetrahydropterin synthase